MSAVAIVSAADRIDEMKATPATRDSSVRYRADRTRERDRGTKGPPQEARAGFRIVSDPFQDLARSLSDTGTHPIRRHIREHAMSVARNLILTPPICITVLGATICLSK